MNCSIAIRCCTCRHPLEHYSKHQENEANLGCNTNSNICHGMKVYRHVLRIYEADTIQYTYYTQGLQLAIRTRHILFKDVNRKENGVVLSRQPQSIFHFIPCCTVN